MLVCSCKSKLHVVGVDGRYGVAELVSQEQLLGARGGHSIFKGVTAPLRGSQPVCPSSCPSMPPIPFKLVLKKDCKARCFSRVCPAHGARRLSSLIKNVFPDFKGSQGYKFFDADLRRFKMFA